MSLDHHTPGCQGLWFRTRGTGSNGKRALVCGSCHRVHPTSDSNVAQAATDNMAALAAQGTTPMEMVRTLSRQPEPVETQ
jgi:hypothetical protein